MNENQGESPPEGTVEFYELFRRIYNLPEHLAPSEALRDKAQALENALRMAPALQLNFFRRETQRQIRFLKRLANRLENEELKRELPIETQGNFMVFGPQGERRAAFALESDRDLFETSIRAAPAEPSSRRPPPHLHSPQSREIFRRVLEKYPLHKPKPNCPHCGTPLAFVVVTVTHAIQMWSVGEKGLLCSNTEVNESSEPRCWNCDEEVGDFLNEQGIYCEWTPEKEEEHEDTGEGQTLP